MGYSQNFFWLEFRVLIATAISRAGHIDLIALVSFPILVQMQGKDSEEFSYEYEAF